MDIFKLIYLSFFLLEVFLYFRIRFLIKSIDSSLFKKLFITGNNERTIDRNLRYLKFTMLSKNWDSLQDPSLRWLLQIGRISGGIWLSFHVVVVAVAFIALFCVLFDIIVKTNI